MTFLYPNILYALFLNAIPILIHLVNLQRTKKVYFTNTAFLKEVKNTTNKSYQLKRFFILCARILFLSFLVIAFAQPVLKNKSSAIDSKNVGIYIDNSASMESSTDGKVLLDEAIVIAEALARQNMKKGIVHLSSNKLTENNNFLSKDKELLETLSRIEYDMRHLSLDHVIRRQIDALNRIEKQHEAKELIVISDFQKSTIGNDLQSTIDSNTKVKLVKLNTPSSGNLIVDSVWLVSPYIKSGEIITLQVKVNNTGDQDIGNSILKLKIGDEQVSSVLLNISKNSSKVVQLNFTINKDGIACCKLELSDRPYTFDNTFFFTLNVAAKINVAIISEDTLKNNYAVKVFENEPLFNLYKFHKNNINYEVIAKTDLLILNGVQKLDRAALSNVEDLLKSGGSMCYIPSHISEKSFIDNLNKTISGLGASVAILDSATTQISKMEAPKMNLPFFQNIFSDYSKKMEMPFFRALIKVKGSVSSILGSKNGDNALIEVSGQGRCWIFTSPLENEFTNFHKHSLFVPVMYKIAMTSARGNQNLYSRINDKLTIRDRRIKKTKTYSLKNADIELIPRQVMNEGQLSLDLTDDNITPGFYGMNLNESDSMQVAINVSSKESMVSAFSRDELIANFEHKEFVEVLEVDDVEAFKKIVTNGDDVGKSYWKIAIMLSLAFLLVEIALIKLLK